MNLQTRLDNVARALPRPPAKANQFSDMTDDELNQVGREALEQLKAGIITDPTSITTLDPALFFLFDLEREFYNRPYQAIGAKPIPVELDDLDRQMIPKLQGLVDSDPHSLDTLPPKTIAILKEKGLNV